MTERAISSTRTVGGDYFSLIYSKPSKNKLGDFLGDFNFDDYWCFKATHRQRLASYEDLLEFKNAEYVFFRKDLYQLNRLTEWIDWMVDLGGIQFLHKPTPPFSPAKVKILK
jgi:hypothetical protein